MHVTRLPVLNFRRKYYPFVICREQRVRQMSRRRLRSPSTASPRLPVRGCRGGAVQKRENVAMELGLQLFGLPPIVDFAIRVVVTVCLLYILYAWLDYLYRGNNRYPRFFGALDRGTDFLWSMLMLAPFRGKRRD